MAHENTAADVPVVQLAQEVVEKSNMLDWAKTQRTKCAMWYNREVHGASCSHTYAKGGFP